MPSNANILQFHQSFSVLCFVDTNFYRCLCQLVINSIQGGSGREMLNSIQGSPTLALNAYERRLRPWDHQNKWCSSDRKGTSILKGIWYSPAIPLLYDTIAVHSSSSIISKDQRGEVDVMFDLVRFLLFHCFSDMQYQSWLDLAKIFVAEKWDSRRMTFLH